MVDAESDGSEFQETLCEYEPKERNIEDLASDEEPDLTKQEEALANVAAEMQARDSMADDSEVAGSFVTVNEGGNSVVRFIATDGRSLEEARTALASNEARVEFEEVDYSDRKTVIEQFTDEYNLPTPHGLPGRNPEDPFNELEQLTDQLAEITRKAQSKDKNHD